MWPRGRSLKQPTAERRKSTRPFFSSIMKGSKIVKKSCLHIHKHNLRCVLRGSSVTRTCLCITMTCAMKVRSALNQPCLHTCAPRCVFKGFGFIIQSCLLWLTACDAACVHPGGRLPSTSASPGTMPEQCHVCILSVNMSHRNACASCVWSALDEALDSEAEDTGEG